MAFGLVGEMFQFNIVFGILEAREITDKGTLNHPAVLKNRATVVDRLHLEPVATDVFNLPKELCHTC